MPKQRKIDLRLRDEKIKLVGAAETRGNREERKRRRKGEKRVESADNERAGRSIPITPQMIRLAVRELHSRRVYVNSSLIAEHLRRFYPIESDSDALMRELKDKLEDAVSVGLIAQCGEDAYCLPTLRQQTSSYKTDLTRFWNKYHKRYSRSRLENPRGRTKKSFQRKGAGNDNGN